MLSNWTNSSTGKVIFTMPSVPIGDNEFIINASIPGELKASHSILVKNRTGLLNIEFSTDNIIETEEFYVTIKNRDELISDANVWFNSAKYITDKNGQVTLTAPDVLITTNYGISVNKTDYKSNSKMVTINDESIGSKLMEVIYPSIVEPNEENIDISVIGKNDGLENVTINLYYEDIKYSQYKTDINGNAIIHAPSINNDHYFSLYFYKEGYKTYYVDKEIKINLFTRDLNSNLDMTIIPSEVYEGDTVTVEVTDEIGANIEDATIWKGSQEMDESTDSKGILEFITPSVFFDREYYIYAIKKGYNYAEGKFTIRDKNSIQKKLNIETITIANESDVFYVTIKDDKNIPLDKITVIFNSEERITNENGTTYLIAPNVTIDTFYTITAAKYGYIPASTSIEVINVGGGSISRKIEIFIVPHIMENENFTVVVKNEHGNLLPGARVKFMDTSLYTDYKGIVTFTAPDVNWDRVQEILVTKSAFESASTEITIKNNEDFQYLYLLIAIIIIFIIGLIAFFKYRHVF